MKNLAEVIAKEFRNPEGRNLQERCLESMVLMERYRRMPTVTEIVPNTIDADISSESISSLADALAEFIKAFTEHPDVGSAIWALGKFGAPRFATLFEAVLATDSRYNEFAQHQATISLENLGFGPKIV